MFTKQCFVISNKIYKIQDIYGYEDNENAKSIVEDPDQEINNEIVAHSKMISEGNHECIICYTNIKDTIVYPCRHICLCLQCAQIVKVQCSQCPIDRCQAKKFINININVQNRDQEEQKE